MMMSNSPFDALLHEVCVDHGWCGGLVGDKSMYVTDLLPKSGEVTADQFVSLLFQADGVDPAEDQTKWQPHLCKLREIFIRHMGSEKVSAELLQ